VSFFSSSFFLAIFFSSALSSAAFSSASVVSAWASEAFDLEVEGDASLGAVAVALAASLEGVLSLVACGSLGSGFLAWSALKPGGGKPPPGPEDVEVSVAKERYGSSMAIAGT